MQEQIQRSCHHAFGRILYTDYTVLGATGGRGVKDLIKVGAVDQVGCAAEKFDRRLLAKSAGRPEHGDALRRFQRQTG